MEQQQSRQQQLHQHPNPNSLRPRSSQSGSFLQFDNRPCSPSTCRVSDCWSPTSDGLDPALSASQRVTPSRPLGGLEKVIEYRPVPNGHGIELRRITASKEGPVEHIQVNFKRFSAFHKRHLTTAVLIFKLGKVAAPHQQITWKTHPSFLMHFLAQPIFLAAEEFFLLLLQSREKNQFAVWRNCLCSSSSSCKILGRNSLES